MDREFNANSTWNFESSGLRRYIPLTIFPARMVVPSGFVMTPLPSPNVVVNPALSRVLTETKFAFNAGHQQTQGFGVELVDLAVISRLHRLCRPVELADLQTWQLSADSLVNAVNLQSQLN